MTHDQCPDVVWTFQAICLEADINGKIKVTLVQATVLLVMHRIISGGQDMEDGSFSPFYLKGPRGQPHLVPPLKCPGKVPRSFGLRMKPTLEWCIAAGSGWRFEMGNGKTKLQHQMR